MDAEIASEDNLALISEKGYDYVCVSRKRLKDYPMAQDGGTIKTVSQLTDRDKRKVELSVFHPESYTDTWVYVQSDAKKEKEASMTEKLSRRFEEEQESVKGA